MAQTCVNKKDKGFVKLSTELNIHPDSLEGVVDTYFNKEGVDGESMPSIDYIKEQYGLTGESKTAYDSNEKFKATHEIWKDNFSKEIDGLKEEESNRFYSEVSKVFSKQDIKVIPRIDGTYTVKVLEPKNNKLSMPVVKTEIKDNLKKDKEEIPIEFIEDTKRKEAYYENSILKPSQRSYLTTQAVKMLSNVLDGLEGLDTVLNKELAKKIYLPQRFENIDLSNLNRKEIVDTVGIQTLFETVKNYYYDSFNVDGISKEYSDQLDVAYENFDLLLDEASASLSQLEGIKLVNERIGEVYNTESNGNEGVLQQDSESQGEQPRESWQLGTKHISGRDSLSPLIKRKLEKIKLVDENGSVQINNYGMPLLLDGNAAYGTLIRLVNSSLSVEEMEEKMIKMLEVQPWIQQVLDAIKNEPFRSQFFSNFRKDSPLYSVVTQELDFKTGDYIYKTVLVNSNTAESVIVEEIKDGWKSNETELFTDFDELTGKAIVNINKINELQNKVNNIKNLLNIPNHKYTKDELNNFISKNQKEIKDVLFNLGLPVSDSVLKMLVSKVHSISESFNNIDMEVVDLINNISELLNTLEKGSKLIGYTPLISKSPESVLGFLNKIATEIAEYMPDEIEASIFENGKMYYSYTVPSYLGKLMLKFKNSSKEAFEEFIEKEYRQSSWFYDSKDDFYTNWLQLMTGPQSEKYIKMFDHKVQIHFAKSDYGDQDAIQRPLSMIHEYFSDFGSKNPEEAWYALPILADKPSAEFIKFKRYTDENTSGGYKNELLNQLTRVGLQELKRIKSVLERSKNKNISKISSYDVDSVSDLGLKGGAKFNFLSYLNPLFLQQGRLNTLITEFLEENNENLVELIQTIKEESSVFLEQDFKNMLTILDEVGVTQENNTTGKEVPTFKHLSQIASNRSQLENKLREYHHNSFVADINIIQLSVTDLAFYKDAMDFQKRFSQVHAPAIKGNLKATDRNGVRYSKDGITRTIYLQDDIIVSEIKNEVSNIYNKRISDNALTENQKKSLERQRDHILKLYEGINVSDAQGYTSLNGIRTKLGIFGRWENKMEDLFEKIKNKDWDLNDLNVMFQPLKPFVFSNIHKEGYSKYMDKIKVPVTNKNSEYVLMLTGAIIQGARGGNNKLSALADFMDENNIDTIQFDSAVKTGKQGAVSLNGIDDYNQVKKILKEYTYTDETATKYNTQVVHEISLEDYGIQQEVPDHLIDHEQQVGSQARKLITADFSSTAVFNVNNNLYSGREFRQHFNEIVSTQVEESYNTLIDDLNLNSKSRFDQNLAMSELLSKEIKNNISRYGVGLLRAVTLNTEGEFTVPLVDPLHSDQIQKLLASIIKSRIVKQKINGGPVVLVSAYGLSDQLEIKFKEDGVTIECMECYLPAYSEEFVKPLLDIDANGKQFININKLDEDGNKIFPDELRDIIGYRIPTEDKYSLAPLRIKGFLSNLSGSGIILPREITLLSGSDFDVDKLYVMLPEFIKSKNKFKKVKYNSFESPKENRREQRNNEMLDMMFSVLTNPDTSDKIFNPGGFDDLKKTARIVELAKSTSGQFKYNEVNRNTLKTLTGLVSKTSTKVPLNVLSPTTQYYFHAQNTVAKKLIGAVANHNTSHAVMQDNPVSLIMDYPLTLNGVTINSTTLLDKLFALDGITYISKNTGSMVASSVDAVKDPVLNTLNINPFTVNVASTLIRYGFDFDTIGLFLTQPSIVKLTQEYFKQNSNNFALGESIINSFIEKTSNSLGGVNIKSKLATISNNKFLKNELFNSLGVKTENRDNKWKEYQLDVLVLFSELYKKSKDVNELTFMTKFDTTNSVPSGIAEFMTSQLRVNKFYNSFNDKFILENKNKSFLEGHFVKSFLENTVKAFDEVFSSNFPYFNSEYTNILESANALTDNNLNAKLINQIFQDYNYFKFTQLDSFNGNIKNRTNYLYDFPLKVKKELIDNPELANNDLIKVIRLVAPKNNIPFHTINLKVFGLNMDAKQKIQNGWNELLENPKYKELAIDLFSYNLYRNGFQFSPTTFLHIAPIELRKNIDGYLDFLRPNSEIGLFSNSISNESYQDQIKNAFINQFVRNNAYDTRLIPQFELEELNIISSSENSLELNFEEGGPLYLGIIETGVKDKTKKSIYKKVGSTSYIPVSELGINNQAKEYDFYEYGNLESAIKTNKINNINFRKRESILPNISVNTPSEIIENSGVNIDMLNDVISKKFNISKEELKKSEGEPLNPKLDAFIKAAYPNFDNMSSKEQMSIKEYLSKEIIDEKEDKIC